jgi:phosphoribosylpyrophosphate synthetase
VRIQDGDPSNKDVIIVDDLVQTGGTLYECAVALRAMGAREVRAFVAHAVFPNAAWKAFCKNSSPPGERAVFDRFYLTNSAPTVVCHLPRGDVFEVLDLLPLVVADLDNY